MPISLPLILTNPKRQKPIQQHRAVKWAFNFFILPLNLLQFRNTTFNRRILLQIILLFRTLFLNN